MRTKQTDTAAMTEEQLDAVAGGAPHYQDFSGQRFQKMVYEKVDKRSVTNFEEPWWVINF